MEYQSYAYIELSKLSNEVHHRCVFFTSIDSSHYSVHKNIEI